MFGTGRDELKAAQAGQDPEKGWRPIARRLEDLQASPVETDQYKRLWQQVDAAQQQRKRLDDLKSWSDQQAESIKAPEEKLDEYGCKQVRLTNSQRRLAGRG